MKLEKKIQVLHDYFAQREEIAFAYVFGSQVKGTSGKLSDLDIAVYIDENKLPSSGSFGYEGELIVELQKILKENVDLAVLNCASTFLCFQVIKHGRLVFCRSPVERVRFHSRVMGRYHDFKPAMKVQSHYLRKRIKRGLLEES